MYALSGLVACKVCMRSGPGEYSPFALPAETEGAALESGWRFLNGWVCAACLSSRRPA